MEREIYINVIIKINWLEFWIVSLFCVNTYLDGLTPGCYVFSPPPTQPVGDRPDAEVLLVHLLLICVLLILLPSVSVLHRIAPKRLAKSELEMNFYRDLCLTSLGCSLVLDQCVFPLECIFQNNFLSVFCFVLKLCLSLTSFLY